MKIVTLFGVGSSFVFITKRTGPASGFLGALLKKDDFLFDLQC